jgi:hypothetical protein
MRIILITVELDKDLVSLLVSVHHLYAMSALTQKYNDLVDMKYH